MYRRRRLIVDKPLQARMVLAYSWPPAVAMSLAAAALCFFAARLVQEASVRGQALPSLTPLILAAVAVLVTAIGFVVVAAVQFSHRVVGPTFRIRRVLEAALRGEERARAHLRPKDYLHDVAIQVNSLLDAVHSGRLGPATTPQSAVSESVGEPEPVDSPVTERPVETV